MSDTAMDIDEDKTNEPQPEKQGFLLHLADLVNYLSLPDNLVTPSKKKALAQEIMQLIQQNNMGPYYKFIIDKFPSMISLDASMLEQLEAANKTKIEQLDAAIKDAAENYGETEVRDAHHNKAKYFNDIGDKAAAIAEYELAFEKTIGTGQKIDLIFEIIRMGFAWNDPQLIKSYIFKSKALVDKGGDWERRNRLKVYEGTYLMMVRDFAEASKLFLDSVATFTCTELYDYPKFVWYVVISSMVSIDRVTLRDKLVRSPDILSVLSDIPNLEQFLHSFYKCNYDLFFRSLVGVIGDVAVDRYISAHHKFLLRGLRVVAYTQFLQSYKSVTVSSMSKSFGVSEDFLDNDLSQFVASGKLMCKIDKVRGIVESTRLDGKNTQYLSVIKQGDHLLNRTQKLARVITY